MGIFDKFKTAETMGTRQYIEEGIHVFEIRRVEQGLSKNPKSKGVEKTVVEFSIVESDAMKAGISCSLVEMETLQGYAGNVLSFVAGVLGVTVDDLKADEDFENVFGAVFGTDQLFTGMLVKCVAQKVATKKGGEYTAKSWMPVHAEDYAKYDREAPSGAPSKLAA
jgi:hypothetical protein